MAIVQIPPVLRSAVGGEKSVQAEGETLGTLLDDLYERYPALRQQLKPGDDRLSRSVTPQGPLFVISSRSRRPNRQCQAGRSRRVHRRLTDCLTERRAR